MIKRIIGVAALTGVFLLAWSDATQAQKKVEKTDEEIRAERMKRLTLAYELAAMGRDKQAPEQLIAAAGILRELSQYKELENMKTLDVMPEITDDKGNVVPAEKSAPPVSLKDQGDEMYRDASDMAAALNVNVDKLIGQSKKRVDEEIAKNAAIEKRAVVGGPKQVSGTVKAGQTATYKYNLHTHAYSEWCFNSKAPLTVAIFRSDDNQPLFFGTTTVGAKAWHPNWHPNPKLKQAPITIKIQNFSKQPVQFQFMIQ